MSPACKRMPCLALGYEAQSGAALMGVAHRDLLRHTQHGSEYPYPDPDAALTA